MYDDSNIFARIIRGELPADVVYDDSDFLAIKDIRPAAPVHILVMPKKPWVSFDDFVSVAPADEVAKLFKIVHKVATSLGLEKSGYRVVTNHGRDGGQEVPHLHVHILGGGGLSGL